MSTSNCKCRIEYGRKAKKFLENAPRDIAEEIEKRLEELSINPTCVERLKGRLSDLCKMRVGSYRIAYYPRPCHIVVVAIGKRENFYDKL